MSCLFVFELQAVPFEWIMICWRFQLEICSISGWKMLISVFKISIFLQFNRYVWIVEHVLARTTKNTLSIWSVEKVYHLFPKYWPNKRCWIFPYHHFASKSKYLFTICIVIVLFQNEHFKFHNRINFLIPHLNKDILQKFIIESSTKGLIQSSAILPTK